MTNQQELPRGHSYNYEDMELRNATERYSQPAQNEKSPDALRVFVIGKHLEMLRNEIIRDGNEQ